VIRGTTLTLIVVLAAIVLAGCGSTPVVTPVAIRVPPTAAPTRSPPSDPRPSDTATATPTPAATVTSTPVPSPTPLNPLTVRYLRQREYPGSEITIEQTLAPGANYNRYIASYESDGLKIYALLTVPKGPKPKTGWPVIIFNHGFIPPAQYRTTERYVAYVDALARGGYIVFKSDYRGHGNSEGDATGGYGSPAYTIDVLNAITSMERFSDADPNRIGMWGHSMGGQVTLRAMVTTKSIKAGVIWSGVVGSYPNLINNWHRRSTGTPAAPDTAGGFPFPGSGRRWRQDLIEQYGTPEENPEFWASLSPNSYVSDLSGPLQLHHDIADGEVPVQFSQELYDEVKQTGKSVEFYTYPGNDHNLAQSFTRAMQRTIAFFDKYVKQSG
jgi:fermentation-respiration switch protein FrsA (DUF1100 family)